MGSEKFDGMNLGTHIYKEIQIQILWLDSIPHPNNTKAGNHLDPKPNSLSITEEKSALTQLPSSKSLSGNAVVLHSGVIVVLFAHPVVSGSASSSKSLSEVAEVLLSGAAALRPW
jgi:hypothetical protein